MPIELSVGLRPLVSVCIPTVDRLEYVQEAIASAAAQTLDNIEIVVADNSADAAYQRALDRFVSELPSTSVRVYHHPARLRMVDNANFLVDAGRGKYWMYLPDDDRLLPGCVAELVAALEAHSRAAIACCDHWIIDGRGRRDPEGTEITSARFGRTSLKSGLIEHHRLMGLVLQQSLAIQCLLFRTETIRRYRFDERYEPVLDFDLELRLASDPSIDAYYCASRLVEYRVHGAQTTAARVDLRTLEAMVGTLDRCMVTRPDDESARRRLVRRYRRSLVLHAAANGARRLAMTHAGRALRSGPLTVGSVLVLFAVLPRFFSRLARALGADSRIAHWFRSQ